MVFIFSVTQSDFCQDLNLPGFKMNNPFSPSENPLQASLNPPERVDSNDGHGNDGHGRVLVISGPSGVGKGTLCKELLLAMPQLALTVSTTSRSKRDSEVDGQDYYFVSRRAFIELIDQDAFLEWAEYNGNLYGTRLSEVIKLTQSGLDVLMEIDVQGALNVRKQLPEARLIFIAPPSLQTLKDRLETRGSNTPEDIAKRLKIGEKELSQQYLFDHVIINKDLNVALQQLVQAIQD
jgi:guanylate kinase